PQHRVEGDHRLARADLSHQEPLHRLTALEIRVDRAKRPALVGGELEGERIEPGPDEVTGVRELFRVALVLTPAPAGHEGELEQEQLLERQPAARERHLLERAREVRDRERRRTPREPLADAEPCRQGLDRMALEAAKAPAELADLARR